MHYVKNINNIYKELLINNNLQTDDEDCINSELSDFEIKETEDFDESDYILEEEDFRIKIDIVK